MYFCRAQSSQQEHHASYQSGPLVGLQGSLRLSELFFAETLFNALVLAPNLLTAKLIGMVEGNERKNEQENEEAKAHLWLVF